MYSAFVFIVLGPILLEGQYVESPCPNVFEYKSDGENVYGVIHIGPMEPSSSILVRANFTITTRLLSNYVGRLAPIGDNPYILDDFNHGMPIDYRVDFPTTSPLPKLTSLTVNDNILCYGPGDVPGPNQYVTTTSLQHTLFLKGQGSNYLGNNGFYNQYEKPHSSIPHHHHNHDSDYSGYDRPGNEEQTQIFTFGGDNQQGWNAANNYPSHDHHANRPPQRQPEPQYYPEVITQPPRPAPTPPPPPPQRPPPNFGPAPSRIPASDTSSATISCGVISGGNEQLPLIYNGQSYNRGDWPWLVAIYKRKNGSLNFICAGTLVSGRHIVTARSESIHYIDTKLKQECVISSQELCHGVYVANIIVQPQNDVFHVPEDKLTTTSLYEHTIELKPHTTPVYVKPYRLPQREFQPLVTSE